MRIDRSEITPEKLAIWPSVYDRSLSEQEQARFRKARLAVHGRNLLPSNAQMPA